MTSPAILAGERTLARSYSGDYVDLVAPDWRTINLNDVAKALAAIRRWNGHTRRPFSVAEHSLWTADRVGPRFRLAALLHDGHEYIMGDLVRPLSVALSLRLGEAIAGVMDAIKYDLDVAIVTALFSDAGIPVSDMAVRQVADDMRSRTVRSADDAMGALERQALWPGPAVETARRDFTLPMEEPDEGLVATQWLRAVREEARRVYLDHGVPAFGAAWRLGFGED